MTCPGEPTLMMLADEELEASAAGPVREHVAGCARCRAGLAGLRAERRALLEALGGGMLDEPAGASSGVVPESARPASGGRWWEPASAAAAVCVVVGASSWAAQAVAAWQVPSFLEWMSPFHPSGRLTWLFTGLRLAAAAAFGGGPLASLAIVSGQVVTTLLLLLALLRVVARASRRVAVTGLLTALCAAAAAPGEALVVRQTDGVVVVAAEETLDDTLVAAAERIVIRGTVTGDVVAGGRQVEVHGTVRGNLVAWAQYVDVGGEVGGSLFATGQEVAVRGSVRGGLYAFGQYVRVLEGGRVAGDVASASQTMVLRGMAGRDVRAGASDVEIDGVVRRNVMAVADGVDVGPRSRIAGTLTAAVHDPDDLRIDAGATLGAEPDVRLRNAAAPGRYLTASFYRRQALWLAAAFVSGWLLLWLAPAAACVLRFETPAEALRTLGVGFLCVVAAPVAAVVAGLTLVGLPVALVTLALWALGIYLAKIPVALFLGRALLGPRGAGGRAPALLVGLLAVLVAVNLPFVGWIVNLALTLIGVGGLFAWGVAAYRGHGMEPARL